MLTHLYWWDKATTPYIQMSMSINRYMLSYHMAVKMSIGEEDIEEKRVYNLTQLRKTVGKGQTKRQEQRDLDRATKMRLSLLHLTLV